MKPDIARILLFCLLSVFSLSTAALPFMIYDPRTLGMGGVGVASEPYFAQYNNPAQLSFDKEFIDWHLIFSGGLSTTDPDNFEDQLGNFQSSASILAATPTPLNANTAAKNLQALTDLKFDEIEVRTIAVTVPNQTLGLSVFINQYNIKSTRAISGVPDISDPTAPQYNSILEKRGLSVVEQGISISHIFNKERAGSGSWTIGFSPKLAFAKTVQSSEDITTADANVDIVNGVSSSAFSLDIGTFKEYGRYKLAFVVKNLIPMKFKYADGTNIRIKPQVRMGFSHIKRKRIWEIDLDLTPNDGVGFTNETLYLSMGLEFLPVKWFSIRTGVRQNFLEDKDTAFSLGMRFGSTIHLEVGALVSEEEQSGIAMFGIEF